MSDIPYVLLVEDEESFADALMLGLTREAVSYTHLTLPTTP